MVRARKQTITSLFCSLQQVLVALWNSADENDFGNDKGMDILSG